MAFKRLALFSLPYVICPTRLEHPKSLQQLYRDVPGKFYSYGLGQIWAIDELPSRLHPIAKIEQPDLKNEDHVTTIYDWWEKECEIAAECQKQLEKLEAERKALCSQIDEKIALCKDALQLRKRMS
jgi:hypothetical protein